MNKGKKWETIVKESWETFLPTSLLLRLPDQLSGYKTTSKNPCDFVGFANGKLFLIECKTVQSGNTLNLSRLTQLDYLLSLSSYDNVKCGFLIWFQERQEVCWVFASTVEKIRTEGKKSVNVSMINDNNYDIVSLPIEVKRVYPKVDLRAIVED